MHLHFYTTNGPNADGSCLVFAKEFSTLVGHDLRKSLLYAQELFNSQYTQESPLILETTQDISLDKLTNLCKKHGIELVREIKVK